MQALLFIISRNFKKKKGELLTQFIMIFIASVMIYLSMTILLGGGQVWDEAFEDYNGCDIWYYIDQENSKAVYDIISSNDEIAEIEEDMIAMGYADFYNRDHKKTENISIELKSFEVDRKYCTLNTDVASMSDTEIIIPYAYSEMYDIGDEFTLTMGKNSYSYTVVDYYADPVFCSEMNVNFKPMIVTGSEYERLVGNIDNCLLEYVEYKCMVTPGSSPSDVAKTITKSIVDRSSSGEFKNLDMYDWDRELMRTASVIGTDIFMVVILVFAVLIIIIAMIVTNYNIKNFIEKDMKNTGILESSGYTKAQLIKAIVVENAGLTFVASLMGTIVGIILMNFVGGIIISLMALPWTVIFNPLSAATAVLVTVLMVGLSCLHCSRAYKKFTVLDALRGGVHSHNFKKNHVQLDKAKTPLTLSLALKEIFVEKRRSISMFLMIMILTISVNTALVMYDNFRDDDVILSLAGQDLGDLYMDKCNPETASKIEALDSVDYINNSFSLELILECGDEICSVNCRCISSPDKLEHDVFIKGRMPETEKEIVITTLVSNELDAEIGDIIYVESNGKTVDYIVVGIDQKIANMGLYATTTFEGGERIFGKSDTFGTDIYLKDGVTLEQGIEDIRAVAPGSAIMNSQDLIESIVGSVSGACVAISLLAVVVTILIVAFVEVLLIRSKMIKQRVNYGVNNALGFTAGQLILQNMMSNLPMVIAGLLIGTLVSFPTAKGLLTAVFSIFGIYKLEINPNILFMLLVMIGIALVAVVTSLICSLPLKKLRPVNLLTEE